jgi:hypothetical protein
MEPSRSKADWKVCSYSVRVSLAQTVTYIMSLGLNDKAMLDYLENLGKEHQIITPNLVTAPTAFGEYTRCGSQVEMSKTPESWDDPMLFVPGSCKPEWTTK